MATATTTILSILQESSRPAVTPPASPSVDRNMELAGKISSYVAEKIPIIANQVEKIDVALLPEELRELDRNMLSLTIDQIDQIVSARSIEFQEILDTPKALSIEKLEAIRRIAANTLAGLSGDPKQPELVVGKSLEMSAVGLDYCITSRVPQKVEVFYIQYSDHKFLVIGRDPASNPEDPSTWGPHAVICDLWSKEQYPASELTKRLMCVDQAITETGTQYRQTLFVPGKVIDSEGHQQRLAILAP
jgi:hypothetical protein